MAGWRNVRAPCVELKNAESSFLIIMRDILTGLAMKRINE